MKIIPYERQLTFFLRLSLIYCCAGENKSFDISEPKLLLQSLQITNFYIMCLKRGQPSFYLSVNI